MIFCVSDTPSHFFLFDLVERVSEVNPCTLIYFGDVEPNLEKRFGNTSVRLLRFAVPRRFPTIRSLQEIRSLMSRDQGGVLINGHRIQFLIAAVARISKKRDLAYIRNYTDTHHRLRFVHWWFIDIATNLLVPNIIAVSKMTKSLLLKKEMVRAKKVIVIHNAFDYEGFNLLHTSGEQALSPSSNLSKNDRIRVVIIARQTEIKGIVYALRGVQSLASRGVPFTVFLIGEASDATPSIEAFLAMESDFECIRIQHTNRIAQILQDCDVLIHTPIRLLAESFGLVFLEGLASGIECIFTKTGVIVDFPKFFDTKQVQIVGYKNSLEISLALQEVLEFKQSSIKKNELNPDLAFFSKDRVLANYLNFLRKNNYI